MNDDTILQVAKENKVAPLLSVTNLSESNFDKFVNTIMKDNDLQEKVINSMIAALKNKGYYG